MITGKDLVKEQIKVARGEKLSFTQKDLSIIGHSIEVRVYAEDPANNFLPDIGKLTTYIKPQGPGIRVDDGFEEGMDIPIYYDPMIAKLTVYGSDRKEAIERMIRAIDEYRITGVETTLPFCSYVLKHEAFVSGNFDTHFVKKYFTPEKLFANNSEEETVAALAGALLATINKDGAKVSKNTAFRSKWRDNRLG
jgi:acetyl-CoA carboxylase biotin carboxylase subunit